MQTGNQDDKLRMLDFCSQLVTDLEDADKKIRVFDIRTYKCIQTLLDNSDTKQFSCAVMDPYSNALVTCGGSMKRWGVTVAPGNKERHGGAAHSAEQSGNPEKAKEYYGKLVEMTVEESTRSEVEQARKFLASN